MSKLWRSTAAALAVVGSALLLAACSSTPSGSGGGATTATSGGGSAGATITIQNFAFSPVTLTVRPGEIVTVVNKDGVAHTLTSTTGAFDTGDIAAGGSTTFKAPTTPGTYRYHCKIHVTMPTDTLIVS